MQQRAERNMDILSKLPALRNVIREIRTSIHENTHMSDVLYMLARRASIAIGPREHSCAF